MSNFVHQEFENDEQFQSTVLSQSSDGSPIHTDNGAEGSTPANSSAGSNKRKRNLPGNPDPDAEVVALSPRTLMATNRYICEVCHKGFQRDQNLQLHRRGHNLPWKLKQRPSTQVKKRVYVCPEPTCVHHDPSRALGDLTGIKKHFCRKHGEKKWKCDKCSKRYAVQSDWKAHTKICGTREYRCDCGTIFSRKDSFVTHRAFCDALAEENYKVNQNLGSMGGMGGILQNQAQELFTSSMPSSESCSKKSPSVMNLTISDDNNVDNSLMRPSFPLQVGGSTTAGLMMMSGTNMNPRAASLSCFSSAEVPPNAASPAFAIGSAAYTSATALLQKAAEMGAKISDNTIAPILLRGFTGYSTSSGMNSIQEGSSATNANMATAAPGVGNMNGGLYNNMTALGDSETTFGDKNLDSVADHQYPRSTCCFSQTGLLDSGHLVLQSEGGTVNAIGGVNDEVYMRGGSEKLTVDFLGVEPNSEHSALTTLGKNRSYQGSNLNLVGLGYGSTAAQPNLHNLHSQW